MWSIEHEKCIQCGTTERKHYAKGLCKRCYSRTREKRRYNNQSERREYLSKKGKESYIEYKQSIDEHLGTSCFFCGFDNPNNRKNGLEKHEVYGKDHSTARKYYRENIKDFVLLCIGCHKCVHWMMKHLGLKWDEIKALKSTVES